MKIELQTQKNISLLEEIKNDAVGSWQPADTLYGNSIVLAASQDSVPGGYIELEAPKDKCVFVWALFVKRQAQKGMICFRLLETAKELCKWMGIETLWWGIEKDNKRAMRQSYKYGNFFKEDDTHRYFFVKTGEKYVLPNRVS